MISSIISYAVREINEEIPGLAHARFHIDPAVDGIPSILHVDDSYYYKPDLDGNQDRILVQSAQISSSIVHMHITSQLLYTPMQHPAIFQVPNMEVEIDMLDNWRSDIVQLLARQQAWYRALVALADDDWQQLRRHNMISDIQRTAAKELGLKREWLDIIQAEDKVNCPFCGSTLFDESAPICPVCRKVHNPARLAELEARVGSVIQKKVDPITGR